MRHAGFLPRGRGRYLEIILAGASAFTGWGCHQNFYYGDPPYASATTVASTVEGGRVCEMPTQVVEGGATIADPNGRSTTIVRSKAPRVVVSEPDDRPRLSWRRTDPDTIPANTTVQGAIDDDSTVDR